MAISLGVIVRWLSITAFLIFSSNISCCLINWASLDWAFFSLPSKSSSSSNFPARSNSFNSSAVGFKASATFELAISIFKLATFVLDSIKLELITWSLSYIIWYLESVSFNRDNWVASVSLWLSKYAVFEFWAINSSFCNAIISEVFLPINWLYSISLLKLPILSSCLRTNLS